MDTIEGLSDSIIEDDSNSHSKLIEVQHIGVTAKMRSPLHNLLASTSVSEQETLRLHGRNTTYDKFSNSSPLETETETSKILYEMRASQPKPQRLTPSKIEFQLYRKPLKTKYRKQRSVMRKHNLCSKETKEKTVFQRLASFTTLICAKSHKKPAQSPRRKAVKSASPLLKFEQETQHHNNRDTQTQTLPADVRLGIYYFEHGCNDYLRTTDCHPEILSDMLAAKATHCATRFWAEVFGSLHIAVAFVVAFFLQSYRFVLYSLINTLLVGFLHMSSDYFIKPLLTVIFNGFLQPVLIFMHNILSSLRDMLAPVSDNFNNFMKPVATLGKSIRLIDVNYAAVSKTEKEV